MGHPVRQLSSKLLVQYNLPPRFGRATRSARSRFRLYVSFACGLPLIMLAAVAAFDNGAIPLDGDAGFAWLHPRFGQDSCFMSLRYET